MHKILRTIPDITRLTHEILASEADSSNVRQKRRKHSSGATDVSDLRTSNSSLKKAGTVASRSPTVAAAGVALKTAFRSMSSALPASARPA